NLRLGFEFIKIHKAADMPYCQDDYGAGGNPINNSIIAVNNLAVFFQPNLGHESAKFRMALQFRNGTNQASCPLISSSWIIRGNIRLRFQSSLHRQWRPNELHFMERRSNASLAFFSGTPLPAAIGHLPGGHPAAAQEFQSADHTPPGPKRRRRCVPAVSAPGHACAIALARSAWQRSRERRKPVVHPALCVAASHSDTSFGTSERTTTLGSAYDL